MFYSHELLRSNEGGVATIWIVATLGPKSAAKKVTRRQILGVNVPKACRKIQHPDAPIALRLQSNLLCGVSRVYGQQCDFVLTDAQQAQLNLRALIKKARQSDINLKVTSAHPRDLVLQDDPAFFPDADLPEVDLNASMLQISNSSSIYGSSLLSPHTHLSSATSGETGDNASLGLIIPPSESDVGALPGGFSSPSAQDYGSAQGRLRLQQQLEEEGPLDLHPAFTIDEDGNLNMLELDERQVQEQQDIVALPSPTGVLPDPAALSQPAPVAQQQLSDQMDVDVGQTPVIMDDDVIMPEAEPFPPMAAEGQEEEELSSESAQAPQQRKSRGKAFITLDRRTQIPASILSNWNDNYVANMRTATKEKRSHQAPWIAKANAVTWIFGRGIGGIGGQKISIGDAHPLAIFAGDKLRAALTDNAVALEGDKRKRRDEEDQEVDMQGRHVRARTGSEEVGRGENMILDDDMGMSGTPLEVEQGRRGSAAPLDDFGVSFPWSGMASRQASIAGSLPFGGSAGGLASSAARRSSAQPAPFERRGSRITSASPLFGRGQRERYSSLEIPAQEEAFEDLPAGFGSSVAGEDDDFQLYGPAAGVSTQVAADSQWMKATLDTEGNNFLEFVKAQVEEKRGADGEDELAMEPGENTLIAFEDMLPPTQHTKIVAAQALHHVLALATKGLLDVHQDEGYGPIVLGLTSTT